MALELVLQEQLTLIRARISKAQEPAVASCQSQRIVPTTLRTGWPREALEVMQRVDELQAQILTEEQQRKDAMQAFEAEFMQRMIQHEEKLRSLQYQQRKHA